VYLRVTEARGSVAQGSGFFGIVNGIVLTNAHVLGMLDADGRRPQHIEVVVNSGERDEQRVPGQVLGVDRESDLAVLKVSMAQPPTPLEVKSAMQLQETQPVYVFGFPLGKQLGKNITVSQSSISSLRKDEFGGINKVQVNGGMHPGNSGGPVVDANGDVVGVAVSGYVGTQINFAVPGDYVHAILNGRIAQFSWEEPYLQDGKTIMPVSVVAIDPLNQIREVAVQVWAGAPGNRRPGSITEPPLLPGDSEHMRMKLDYQGGAARGEVVLPALPAGQVYWRQPSYVNGTGQTRWISAGTWVLKHDPVVREPVELSLQHRPGLRPLTLDSKSTLRIRVDEEELKLQIEMNTKFNEQTRAVSPQGLADVYLKYTDCNLTVRLDNKPVKRSEERSRLAKELARFGGAALAIDREGNLKRNQVDVQRAPLAIRKRLVDLHQQISKSLEGLAVPVPNRRVNPLESWTATRTLPIDSPDKPESGVLSMTYTYLGTRTRDGRREAVIQLKGQARGVPGQELRFSGRAGGIAYFDLETSDFAYADYTAKVDLDLELGESATSVKANGTLSARIIRKF
jgi:hypothetical protein